MHTGKSGVAHMDAPTEEEGIALVKTLLAYLPQNNSEEPPQIVSDDPIGRMDEALNALIPDGDNTPYDIRDAIEAIFDQESFLEVQPNYAANAVVGFARLDGYSVGIIANQPCYMSGALNIDASDKIARHIRLCDAFNVPIVTFIDCPGFLPGTGQEYGGVIRHGAKIIYAYCEATVPKVSLVTRKAMGGAYVAMSSRQMRTDVTFAWPTGQIAVMGGLLSDEERRTIEKIPLLGDIPLLGNLFRSKAKSRNKTNLMIFIRPTILRSAADSRKLAEQRYGYLRLQQGMQSPDEEPSIDQLIRDYLGAAPPIPSAPIPGNIEDPRITEPIQTTPTRVIRPRDK